ncbi:hypothetical protein PMIN06_005309 [Paraphaeosphaeria minitans]
MHLQTVTSLFCFWIWRLQIMHHATSNTSRMCSTTLRTHPIYAFLTMPAESAFVYKYLRDNLPSFADTEVPLAITKRILREALRGIATLHGKGIVHTGVKANNMLTEWKDQRGEITVERVQVADIEDAAYIPDVCFVRGR